MTVFVTPKKTTPKQLTGAPGAGGLAKLLAETGRFPPVKLIVKPLESKGGVSGQAGDSFTNRDDTYSLDLFLNYNFSSSILVPVDAFSFSFSAPNSKPINDIIKAGDLVTLTANDIPICTGIIDQIEVETDMEGGERVSLIGRDLMGQLEDQDAISLDSAMIAGQDISVRSALSYFLNNTRITQADISSAPGGTSLLATEPGESKLAALQRFMEPLNCVAWMDSSGKIILGKPNMSQEPRGTLGILKGKRMSNVLSMKTTRAPTKIANRILVIVTEQESTQNQTPLAQQRVNAAEAPARLFKLGHRLPKAVVIPIPTSSDPQSLAAAEKLRAGGAAMIDGYAKRELARQNIDELIVQAVVAGHYNEDGEPFVTDTVYQIQYDRDNIDRKMFLYQVDYNLTSENGQTTHLFFCNLGCIVADVSTRVEPVR